MGGIYFHTLAHQYRSLSGKLANRFTTSGGAINVAVMVHHSLEQHSPALVHLPVISSVLFQVAVTLFFQHTAHHNRISRVEIVGGYYYNVMFQTSWENFPVAERPFQVWIDYDRSRSTRERKTQIHSQKRGML